MRNENWREIPRKELVRVLKNAIATHFLTVVVAPAGYGKTAVAQKLTGQKTRRRFFHSIPEDVANSAHWWDSLFESLAEQGMKQAPALRRGGFPRTPAMARRAIGLLESVDVPFVLILDDFHHFTDPAIDEFLEAVVRANPSYHRLVLFSRVKPNLDLDALARSGLAATYEREFLEFSEADAVRFFFLNGVPDRDAARQAWRYCEGWGAALWLCLLNRKSGGETPLSKGIEDLLNDAVFSRYSPSDREFLMMLSVLGTFTIREAELLTLRADAAGLLRDMNNANVVIRRDDSGGKYVLHNIFRDFLGKRLAAAEVDTPELLRRAAECHIWRRDSLSAFRLLARAGRDDDLLRILDVFSDSRQSIFNARRKELLPLMEKIPWCLRLRQPLGYLHFVWLCFDDEIHDPLSIALFEEMAKRFSRAKQLPAYLRRRLEGEMEFMRGWIYTDAQPELLAPRYENAYTLLDGPSIVRYEKRCWNVGSPHVLFVYLPEGVSYSEMAATMARAFAPMRRLSGGVIEGCDRIVAAEYHLERGEFECVARLVDDLDRILDFPRNMTSVIMARFLRARLLSMESATGNAAAILTGLLHDLETVESPEHIQCAELALGYVLGNCGQSDAAPQWLRDGDIFERPFGVARNMDFMITVCGKLFLAKDDIDGLEAFLFDGAAVFGASGTTLGGIHAAAFRSILAWRRSDARAALRHMHEAVRLSRPDGFVLPIAEYGAHVSPVLRRLEEETAGGDHLERILETAKRIEAAQRRRGKAARRELTARERDVMSLIVKGKSTPAIANRLGVTQSAVKYAAALAYRKMGAANRAEASRLFSRMAEKTPPAGRDVFMPPDIPREMRNAKQALSSRRSVAAAAVPFMRLAGESVMATPSDGVEVGSAAWNRLAAERLQRRDDGLDAFNFFLCAGGDGDLARALELFSLPAGGRMMAYCGEEIDAAVRLFPWPVRLSRPLAYLAYLWRLFRVFDWGTTGEELDEAEYHLSRAGGEEAAALSGEIALLRALLRAHDVEAFWDGCDAARRLLDGPSRLFSPDTSWTFGNPQYVFALAREPGGFARLSGRAASASETLSVLSGGTFTALGAAFRMECRLERGDLDGARELLPELEAGGDADMQALILAAFARSRLLLAEGDPVMAVDLLERLVPHVRRLDSFEHSESLDLALGYIHAQVGKAGKVPLWLREGRIGAAPHSATVRRPFATVVYAKTLLAAGDFAVLESAARTMPTRFGTCDSLLGRIHGKVLEAIVEKYYRRENAALDCLEEALSLSRPDGLVFAIAEYREQIMPLLRRFHRHAPGDAHGERVLRFAEQRYSRLASGAEGVRNAHVLTPREREIMRGVVRGGSNATIARRLGVSEVRINKALIAIYRKLRVSNRAEASHRFSMDYRGD